MVVFQTDKPMAPFLVVTLENLLRSFYAKFVRKEVLLEAITTSQLLKIDINAQKNLKSGNNVDVGFGSKFELQQLKSRGKITDAQIIRFKTDVCRFLVVMCDHMKEKSPIYFFCKVLKMLVTCLHGRVFGNL